MFFSFWSFNDKAGGDFCSEFRRKELMQKGKSTVQIPYLKGIEQIGFQL